MEINPCTLTHARKKHPEWKFGTDEKPKYLQSPYKERLESGYYKSMMEAAKDMGLTSSTLYNSHKKHPEWKFGTDKK